MAGSGVHMGQSALGRLVQAGYGKSWPIKPAKNRMCYTTSSGNLRINEPIDPLVCGGQKRDILAQQSSQGLILPSGPVRVHTPPWVLTERVRARSHLPDAGMADHTPLTHMVHRASAVGPGSRQSGPQEPGLDPVSGDILVKASSVIRNTAFDRR